MVVGAWTAGRREMPCEKALWAKDRVALMLVI